MFSCSCLGLHKTIWTENSVCRPHLSICGKKTTSGLWLMLQSVRMGLKILNVITYVRDRCSDDNVVICVLFGHTENFHHFTHIICHSIPIRTRRQFYEQLSYDRHTYFDPAVLSIAHKLKNRHISSRCGPGHMTQFDESRSKI